MSNMPKQPASTEPILMDDAALAHSVHDLVDDDVHDTLDAAARSAAALKLNQNSLTPVMDGASGVAPLWPDALSSPATSQQWTQWQKTNESSPPSSAGHPGNATPQRAAAALLAANQAAVASVQAAAALNTPAQGAVLAESDAQQQRQRSKSFALPTIQTQSRWTPPASTLTPQRRASQQLPPGLSRVSPRWSDAPPFTPQRTSFVPMNPPVSPVTSQGPMRRHSMAETFSSQRLVRTNLTDAMSSLQLNYDVPMTPIESIDDYFSKERRPSRSFDVNGAATSPVAAQPVVLYDANQHSGRLWCVEFKSGRSDVFYVAETRTDADADWVPQCTVKVGDLVIVEADRGKDLGKVMSETTFARLLSCTPQLVALQEGKEWKDIKDLTVTPESPNTQPLTPGGSIDESSQQQRLQDWLPKRILRLALPVDVAQVQAKALDESKAMLVCQAKVRQRKLPMEVVDAEYQWDRRKLTFYFVSAHRIDFRELVRELFKIYKTRIWMCAVDKQRPFGKPVRPGVDTEPLDAENKDKDSTAVAVSSNSLSAVDEE